MPPVRRRQQSRENQPIITYAIVAIFWVALFFFLSGNNQDSSNGKKQEVITWATLKASANSWTEAYVILSNDSKQMILTNVSLSKEDKKIRVEKWELSIQASDGSIRSYLDKNSELNYNWFLWWSQVFTFTNGQYWIENITTQSTIHLRNFDIQAETGSILLLDQNQISSRVYVLQWKANVSSEGKTAEVYAWKKLSLLNSEKNLATLRISEKVEPFDDIVKQNNFFLDHWWDVLLVSLEDSNTTNTWDIITHSWIIQTNSWDTILNDSFITVTSPEDERTISTALINIEWTISNKQVSKITINDKDASINKTANTFIYKDFKPTWDINNIVFKAFSSDGNLLQKWAISIYTNKEKILNETKPTVTAYPISEKNFKITAPTENPYKTTEDVIKIQWVVMAWMVKYITINDYRLTSFKAWGTIWHYFANKDFGTLKDDSINTYEIKYFWQNSELLSRQQFTIIKEKRASTVISGEVITNR
mgnify:CR=1 FL=1